MKFDYKAELQL